MAANIEVLLDMCLGACLQPGIINVDLNALKRFLHDLSHGVQDIQKMNPHRLVDDLTIKFHKMTCDLERVQNQMNDVQKDSNTIEDITRDVESIKMDLVDLADCSRLMNSTLQKLREQLLDSPSPKNMGSADYLNHLEDVVVQLVKRVENIEHRKGQRKSRGSTQPLGQAETKGVQGKDKTQKKSKYSPRRSEDKQEEEKAETSQCETAGSGELRASMSTGRVALATAFQEFMAMLNLTQFVKPSTVEEFLNLIKESDEITPEMIKELMASFSKSQGVPSSLVTKLIAKMEKADGLTLEAIVTMLDMVQTLPFMHHALSSLLRAIQDETSFPAEALLEILEILRSAIFVDAMPLANMLANVSRQEGFMKLLHGACIKPIFSIANVQSLINICKGMSKSGLLEIITLMEYMDPEDLKEMLSTLFTIPGYFTELLSSLPVVPSMEVQNLALRLTSLSGEVLQLIKEFINMTANSWTSRSAILQSLKEVISIVMDDPNFPDGWLVHLLNLFKTTVHVRLEHVIKFLSLIKDKNCLGSDALHVFIDIFRLNELTPRAVVEFLTVLRDCGVTPAMLTRLLRMLSNSTSITPSGLSELLNFMDQTNLLREDFFEELRDVANSCQLLTPSNITELLRLVKDVNFMTLEDLSNAMQKLNFVSKEELDDHLRQMSHVHSQQMQILEDDDDDVAKSELVANDGVRCYTSTSGEVKEPEEDVLSRLASVNDISPRNSSIGDVSEQIISPNQSEERLTADQRLSIGIDALSALESKVEEVEVKQTAIIDILTSKGQPQNPQTPRKYRSDVTLPSIFPPDPSKYPVIRIVADKSVETEEKVSDSGVEQSEALKLLMEERKCHEQQIQLLEDAIKELQNEQANRQSVNQVKETHPQHADLLRRFTRLAAINESHEEKIKNLQERQDSQEALFVKEQKNVVQDLKKMATKTDLQNFRHGIKEEVISAVYDEILRDSSVACTKRPMRMNCLSCDRKLICLPESPYSQMPALPGFPPARPERPHTVFELNMVRRHARSLLVPHNMVTVDFYALPRQAGGIHTEYVQKEWSSRCVFTYPAQTPDSFIRGADGRVYAGASQPVFLPQVTTTSLTSVGHFSTQNMTPRVVRHGLSTRRTSRKK